MNKDRTQKDLNVPEDKLVVLDKEADLGYTDPVNEDLEQAISDCLCRLAGGSCDFYYLDNGCTVKVWYHLDN